MPVQGGGHEPARDVVAAWARRVDAAAFEAALAEAAGRRQARDREETERLAAEIEEIERRQAAEEAALHQLIDRQQEVLDDADWCRAQPAAERRDLEEIDASRPTVEEHRRHVREANQQLERVLEQRAAADAALEEAQRELADLGSVSVDETGVRRQMEAVSQELATTRESHRAKLADLEATRAEVQRMEAEVAADADLGADDGPEPDQFQALQASIRRSMHTGPAATPEDLAAGRERVAQLEAEVRELAGQMTVQRQRVQGLETELAARSRDGHSLGARQDAAVQLEEQVRAVEKRLGEAEQQARADVEAATRVLSRAELSVERLHASAADRRRRLRELARRLPVEEQDAVKAAPLDAVEEIAQALAEAAADMQPGIERAGAQLEAGRVELSRRRAELQERGQHLDEASPRDRIDAVDHLFSTDAPVVVDLLVDDDRSPLTLADLDAADFTGPVVVLTDAPDVLSWAIGIPAEQGAVVPVQALIEPDPDPETGVCAGAPSSTSEMEQHPS